MQEPGRHAGCCCSGGGRGPLDQPEALARQVRSREGLLTPAGRVCLTKGTHFRQAHPHLCLKQLLQTQEKDLTRCRSRCNSVLVRCWSCKQALEVDFSRHVDELYATEKLETLGRGT